MPHGIGVFMIAPSVLRRPGTIVRFETTTRGSGACDGEIARIFSASGELLREYNGFCDANVPDTDRLLIEQGILTYSHPFDTAFSRKDLLFAVDFRLAEIRVFGKSLVYSMKPRGKEWPDRELLGKKYDEIRNSQEFVASLASFRNTDEFMAKSRDPEMDLFRIRRDLICEKLAEELGLVYQKAAFVNTFATYQPHEHSIVHSPAADAR
jgi:hypothetical protein